METTESVELLWENRRELWQPGKRRRMAKFYELLLQLIESVAEGHDYTLDEMKRSPWWEQLRPKYREWQEQPWSEETVEEMRAAFQTSINLFHSIKETGVRDPLTMYLDAGNRYLILGNRRLVVAHVLGIDSVRVRTFPDRETYDTWRAGDGRSSVGSLDFDT